ncbi:unnamed protein product [Paramecium pentaurelia]|uniref:Major facilitator superfamily (MFS) profile domain-containing protein n=1 Tax=Paramecium pentaurelia TaxID=43138 RepID=A0A8S1TZD4_9CILI|nr:unnamed protein product [Paramecium pentaurelia]
MKNYSSEQNPDQSDPINYSNDLKSSVQQGYRLYQKRFAILFLFTMAELCNTAVYATCNPIAVELSYIYGEDTSIITLSATLYLFMHPLFTFPASYLIMYKGSSMSVKIGAILTLLGVFSRCLVRQSFIYVLIGQTLCGIARPLILNAQASVAVEWFPTNQRTKLMTMLNFIVTFSGILGYIIPPIFFAGVSIDENTPKDVLDTGDSRFMYLLFSEAVFSAVFLIPLLIFFETKPKSPPSAAAKGPTQVISFTDSICQMLKDIKFIQIFLSFTLFYGSYKGYGVALVYILKPYGYGKSDIAILSVMPVIGGFLSSLIIPTIYKSWGRYKPIIIILEFCTIFTFYGFLWGCYLQNYVMMLAMATLQGFFILPAIPLLLEWGCEQIYPLNDSFCIGLQYSGATMGSSFIAQIVSMVIHGKDATKFDGFMGITIICSLYTLAILSILFLKEVKHKLALKKSFVSPSDQIDQSFPHPYTEVNPHDLGLFDPDKVQDEDDDTGGDDNLIDDEKNDHNQNNNNSNHRSYQGGNSFGGGTGGGNDD